MLFLFLATSLLLVMAQRSTPMPTPWILRLPPTPPPSIAATLTFRPLPTFIGATTTTATAAPAGTTTAQTPAPTPAPDPVLTLIGTDSVVGGVYPGSVVKFELKPFPSAMFSPIFMRAFVSGVECPMFFASMVANSSPSSTLGTNEFLIRMPTSWMSDITIIELFIFGRAPLVSVFPTLAFSNDTLLPHLDFVALNNSFREFGSPLGAPKTFFGVTRSDDSGRRRRRRNVGTPLAQSQLDHPIVSEPTRGAKRAISSSSTNKLLIVLAYTSDHAPGSVMWNNLGAFNASAEKARQKDSFDVLVKQWYKQVSYGKVQFEFTVTDFVAMPQDDDYYFWRASDISTAQLAVNANPSDANKEALKLAQERQDTPQRSGDMFYDCLKSASDNGGASLTSYDGIMCVVMAPFLRGAAYGNFDSVSEDRAAARSLSLKPKTFLWYINAASHWGRRVHEIGHSMFSGDQYGADATISTGAAFEIMGSHNYNQRPTGWNLVDAVHWYDSSNVKELKIDGNYPSDNNYDIRAHGLSQDPIGDSTYHVIKINVHETLQYYIEVRQAPRTVDASLVPTEDWLSNLSPAIAHVKSAGSLQFYDTHIYDWNGAAAPHKSGVLVIKTSEAKSEDLNQRQRFITVLGPDRLLQVGEFVEDPANNLRIEIVQLLSPNNGNAEAFPAKYRVRVRWSSAAVVADTQGLFNLRLRNWDSNYQTNDIWFDSPHNGYGTYSYGIEGPTSNALGNGDPPQVLKENRFHAHIWNDGIVDATNLQVTYYLVSPPGVGDNGKWVPLWTRYITGIAAGNRTRVSVPDDTAPLWSPSTGEHTCARVSVSKVAGETNVDDNTAQENVFDFDSAGGSPHDPVLFEVVARNPRNAPAIVRMSASNVPRGWEVTFEYGWLLLPALGEHSVRVTIVNDVGREMPFEQPLTTDISSSVGDKVKAVPGVCCNPQYSSSLASANLLNWKCTDYAIANSVNYKNCTENGGWYRRATECLANPCPRPPMSNDNTIACCLAGKCSQVPATRCGSQGGVALPLGSHCQYDGAMCNGACCYTTRSSKESTFGVLGAPVLRCIDTDRATCELSYGGHLTSARKCADENFECIADEARMQLHGLVDSWESSLSIAYNTERSEHQASIGGVELNVATKRRIYCFYQPFSANSVARYLALDDHLQPASGVGISITIGTCATKTLWTDASGYVDVLLEDTSCIAPNVNQLLIYAEIPHQPRFARTLCVPALYQCTSGPRKRQSLTLPALCPNRIDVGNELCSYDAQKNACSRSTCHNGRRCTLGKSLNGKPQCSCAPPPPSPCEWDKERRQCSRVDCPNDPTMACIQDGNNARCVCKKPEPTPCRFDAQTKQCSRPDCPLDANQRCAMKQLPTGGFDCSCEPKATCEWDDCTKRCKTDRCPTNSAFPCVAKRDKNGKMFCTCALTASQPSEAIKLLNDATRKFDLRFLPPSKFGLIELGQPTCISLGGSQGSLLLSLSQSAALAQKLEAFLQFRQELVKFDVWWAARKANAFVVGGDNSPTLVPLLAFQHWWRNECCTGHGSVSGATVPIEVFWSGVGSALEAFDDWWRAQSKANELVRIELVALPVGQFFGVECPRGTTELPNPVPLGLRVEEPVEPFMSIKSMWMSDPPRRNSPPQRTTPGLEEVELCCVVVAPGLSESVCVKPGNVTLLSIRKGSFSAANFVCDVAGHTIGFIEGLLRADAATLPDAPSELPPLSWLAPPTLPPPRLELTIPPHFTGLTPQTSVTEELITRPTFTVITRPDDTRTLPTLSSLTLSPTAASSAPTSTNSVESSTSDGSKPANGVSVPGLGVVGERLVVLFAVLFALFLLACIAATVFAVRSHRFHKQLQTEHAQELARLKSEHEDQLQRTQSGRRRKSSRKLKVNEQ